MKAMFTIPYEYRRINETLQPSGNQALRLYDINNLPAGINKEDLVQIG